MRAGCRWYERDSCAFTLSQLFPLRNKENARTVFTKQVKAQQDAGKDLGMAAIICYNKNRHLRAVAAMLRLPVFGTVRR